MPGVSHVKVRELLEAARCVETRRELVGERLVVDEAVCAGGANGLFVQTLGVELPACKARDLGANQRGAALEVLRAMRRSNPELSMVGSECVAVVSALFGRCAVVACSA